MYNKNMKLIFISVIAVVAFVATVALFVPSSPYYALIADPLGSPFGGRITSIIPCTCSVPPTMLKITVGQPRGGSFLFIPGVSTLYRNYKLLPPSWVLGTSIGRRECLVGIPPACTSAGFGGTIIRMVGTSLF